MDGIHAHSHATANNIDNHVKGQNLLGSLDNVKHNLYIFLIFACRAHAYIGKEKEASFTSEHNKVYFCVITIVRKAIEYTQKKETW